MGLLAVPAVPCREWATFEEEQQQQQPPSALLQFKVSGLAHWTAAKLECTMHEGIACFVLQLVYVPRVRMTSIWLDGKLCLFQV